MREEERRRPDAPLTAGVDPAENPRHPPKDERHPPKMPPPNQALAQKEKVEAPMDVPTTASSSEASTTTMTMEVPTAVPTDAGEKKEEPLPQFILAPAFMDIVCPECGTLLQGASPTNLKNRQLQHPFGDPPLGGVPCRFKGKMFKTPVIRVDLI